jgi:hypothetical protein
MAQAPIGNWRWRLAGKSRSDAVRSEAVAGDERLPGVNAGKRRRYTILIAIE